MKKIDDYENIYSVNPFYLVVNTVDGHIEEKNGSKYLTFASTDEKTKFWDEIKYLIETINGAKSGEYGKEIMKFKFNLDDDLPLNKPLKFHAMTIIIRPVFDENWKYYQQFF